MTGRRFFLLTAWLLVALLAGLSALLANRYMQSLKTIHRYQHELDEMNSAQRDCEVYMDSLVAEINVLQHELEQRPSQ